uniref:Uncharacterized protein n=1 Tax=Romanomermis culicivorax TaxID=13658 RepID=A0A915I3S5_ROMCU
MKNEESTSLGVAFMVGLSMGLWPNKNELKRFVPKGRIFTPNIGRREILLREFYKWLLATTMLNTLLESGIGSARDPDNAHWQQGYNNANK